MAKHIDGLHRRYAALAGTCEQAVENYGIDGHLEVVADGVILTAMAGPTTDPGATGDVTLR